MAVLDKLCHRLRQLDARQRAARPRVLLTDERHTCAHCRTTYTGHFCPQCGLKHGTSRFTFATLVHRLLDLIGFDEYGNRSILRTLGDLLWRPGYMIRDYLGGHCVTYFQPFKLLLFLSLVYLSILHWMGLGLETDGLAHGLTYEDEQIDRILQPIIGYMQYADDWLSEHIAYAQILLNLLVVNAMWLVFRKRSRYTWTETFVAHMYVACQFMILAIVQLLVTRSKEDGSFSPYFFCQYLVPPILLYDFFQLYRLRLWPALRGVLFVALLYVFQIFLLAVLFVIIIVTYIFFNMKTGG